MDVASPRMYSTIAPARRSVASWAFGVNRALLRLIPHSANADNPTPTSEINAARGLMKARKQTIANTEM